MTIYSVYDQVASLLATLDPSKLMALKATAEMQGRFSNLVEKKHANQLTASEKDELDHYIVLERLIRLAKLRTPSE